MKFSGRLFVVLCSFHLLFRVTLASRIDVEIDKKKEKNHVADSVDLLLYMALLILTVVTLWMFKYKRVSFLHETGLAVIYGLLVGAVLRFCFSFRQISHLEVWPAAQQPTSVAPDLRVNGSTGNVPPDTLWLHLENAHNRSKTYVYSFMNEHDRYDEFEESDIQEKATFDPEIFFYVLLPPIIFHAGYSMRKKQFFDNIGAILAFALLGTVISTFVIGGFMWACAQLITVTMTFQDTLYFGAIISATDPVTILAIFNDLHVDPTLNGLVLGESLLNDAVAIVLSGAIQDYTRLYLKGEYGFESEAFLRAIGQFMGILFGSVGLGSLLGCVNSILTKFTLIRNFHLLESSLFFCMSYSSYLLAEICEMSGIVAVLFCGIFQAHYTFHNLSLESKQRTKQLFELLNFMSENFIFSYIGVSMFTFSRHRFDGVFIVGAIFAIAIARACNIYPLSFVLNLKRKNKIPARYQHMMWFSGLRGAMAFALAMRNTVTESRQIFLTTTSLITILTVIFCGGMTMPLLGWLRIPAGVNAEEHDDPTTDLESANEAVIADDDDEDGDHSRPVRFKRLWFARLWNGFDKKFLKPLLTNSQPTLMETLPDCCLPLARCLTTSNQMGNECNRDQVEGELICGDTESFNSRARAMSLVSGD